MADLTLNMYLKAHDQFSSIMEKAGAEMARVGAAMRVTAGVAGVAGAGIMASSVKAASDYQTMITQVANNTTMGVRGMQQMSKTIQDLAASSGAPLSDLADGYMHITNLGFGAADAQQVLQAAMESALSTGGNVADTANVLANAMHEFGLKGNEAGHAMDVLHLSAAMGNTTLEQLVESAGPAIGMAANLGDKLTDVAAAISAMTRHGMDAGRASTQVIGALQHVAIQAKSAHTELEALSQQTGVNLVADFSQAGIKAKGLYGIISDLRSVTKGQASEILKLIPALRGGLGAMALSGTGFQDFTTDVNALNQAMAGKLTPTAKAFALQQATMAAQMAKLQTNVQLAAIAIGNALLPVLTSLVKTLVPIVQHITEWVRQHAQLAASILTVVSVVGTLLGGLAVLSGMLNFAGMAVGGLTDSIGLGMGAMSTAGEGMFAFLGPIGAVVGGVAVLGVAWSKNWLDIQGKTLTVWNAIKPTLQNLKKLVAIAWDTVTGKAKDAKAVYDTLPGPWRAAVDKIGGVFSTLGTDAHKAWDAVVKNVKHLGSDLMKTIQPDLNRLKAAWHTFTTKLGPAIHSAFEGIKKTVKGALDFINKTIVQPILHEIEKIWNAAWKNGLHQAVTTAWNNIKHIVRDGINAVIHLLHLVIDLLHGNWKGAWNDAKGIAKSVWDAITSSFRAAKTIWHNLITGVTAGIRTAWTDLKTWLPPVLERIKDVVINAWNLVKARLPGIIDGITHGIRDAWNWLHQTAIPNAVNGITSFLTSTWNTVWPVLSPILNGLKTHIADAWDWLWHTGIPNAVNGIKGFLSKTWNTVWPVLSPILGGIKTHIADAWNWLWHTGIPNAVNGIRGAIVGMWTKLSPQIIPTIEGLRDAIYGKWNWLWVVGIPRALNGIKTFIVNTWTNLKPTLGPILTNIQNAILHVWDWLWHTGIPKALAGIGVAVYTAWKVMNALQKPLLQAIQNAITGMWNWLWHGGLGKILDGIKNVVLGEWRALNRLQKPIIDESQKLVTDAWNWLHNTFFPHILFPAISRAVTTGWNAVKSAVQTAVNAVKKVVTDAWNDLINAALSAGKSIVNNIANGIRSVAGSAYSALKDALGPLGKLLPNSPAEEGPLSKPVNFMHVVDSIKAAQAPALAAASALTSAIASAMGGSVGGIGAGGGAISGGSMALTLNVHVTANGVGGGDIANQISNTIMANLRRQGLIKPALG